MSKNNYTSFQKGCVLAVYDYCITVDDTTGKETLSVVSVGALPSVETNSAPVVPLVASER